MLQDAVDGEAASIPPPDASACRPTVVGPPRRRGCRPGRAAGEQIARAMSRGGGDGHSVSAAADAAEPGLVRGCGFAADFRGTCRGTWTLVPGSGPGRVRDRVGFPIPVDMRVQEQG